MNVKAFIASGIIEKYCMGNCSMEEREKVQSMAATYPAIQAELDLLSHSFEQYALANQVKPSGSVKTALMQSIYRQQATSDSNFAPLISAGNIESIKLLKYWLEAHPQDPPVVPYENQFPIASASTDMVTNFFVYVKKGHETEMHDHFVEYLYILDGSCIMNFDGKEKSFHAGELICIEPLCTHTATVTSTHPMLAFVQRQAFA
jgi:mannose-6-phosphate isomerase-like protein (cupin superfamily)